MMKENCAVVAINRCSDPVIPYTAIVFARNKKLNTAEFSDLECLCDVR